MLAAPQPYEELDHTADIGVRVRGASAQEALARLVCVFGGLLTGGGTPAIERELEISVEGGALDVVVVDVLRECLYRFAVERMVPLACETTRLDAARVTVRVGLAPYQPGEGARGTDIKAVTYHAAELCERDGGWIAQVVFDV